MAGIENKIATRNRNNLHYRERTGRHLQKLDIAVVRSRLLTTSDKDTTGITLQPVTCLPLTQPSVSLYSQAENSIFLGLKKGLPSQLLETHDLKVDRVASNF